MGFLSLLWFLISFSCMKWTFDCWNCCAHKENIILFHVQTVHISVNRAIKRQKKDWWVPGTPTKHQKLNSYFHFQISSLKTSKQWGKIPLIHKVSVDCAREWDIYVLFEISLAWAINQPFTHIRLITQPTSYVCFMLELD